MKHEHEDDFDKPKRAPLWKWLLIILLIIAMPLFFSFVRDAQIQQALTPSGVSH